MRKKHKKRHAPSVMSLLRKEKLQLAIEDASKRARPMRLKGVK
jgi:hypothetical protein